MDRVTFLSVRIPSQEWRDRWEESLRAAGVEIDDLDLGDRACLDLVVAEDLVRSVPAWSRSELARLLRVPPKSQGSNTKMHRWLLDHWWQPRVREALIAYARGRCVSPALMHPPPARPEGETGEMAWVAVAWSALHSPDAGAVEAARERWGPEQWDELRAALRAEAEPVLWGLLLRSQMEYLAPQQEAARQLNEMEFKVRDTKYEAAAAQQKHARATDHIKLLQDENERLQAEIGRKDQLLRDLSDLLAEERRAFLDLLAQVKGRFAAVQPGVTPPPLPLAGKRVAIVGGDMIADGAIALVESLGGEAVFCPGRTQTARVEEQVASADMVVRVTADMLHSHDDAIKRATKGSSVPVINVNTLGLGAFRRALEQALGLGEPRRGTRG